MHPSVNEDFRLSCWRRVRAYAVPPSMIETATARRAAGDWAGACAAARVDVDLIPRRVAREYGEDLATRLRADLRQLAPDLLRGHLPRTLPDGLLRPGLTVTLARYPAGSAVGVHLVARTPPAWAGDRQRFSLALWDSGRPVGDGHPHPRPDRRFRLDLHRHLWDARSAGELAVRAGAGDSGGPPGLPPGCAADRWPAEAAILLVADRAPADPGVEIRLGERNRLMLRPTADGALASSWSGRRRPGLPVLPHAATWMPPDVLLLRAGLLDAADLHPLVAAALCPGTPVPPGASPRGAGGDRVVVCRGATHRIGVRDGFLVALDHGADEIRGEELLAALTGDPLPCIAAIDAAHRRPSNLDDIRARLDHGDIAGAVAVVEGLLGPDAALRDGDLRDAIAAATRANAHGRYRSGLSVAGPAQRPGADPGHPRGGGWRQGASRRAARRARLPRHAQLELHRSHPRQALQPR
jgi:hypothetical protein